MFWKKQSIRSNSLFRILKLTSVNQRWPAGFGLHDRDWTDATLLVRGGVPRCIGAHRISRLDFADPARARTSKPVRIRHRA
jgi:hypothetical protein